MPSPYAVVPAVATFEVQSTDIASGDQLGTRQRSGIFGAGGEDRSPHLSWRGFPPATKSFVVTCLDPDAPTGSGFWHWAVVDIPAAVTSLASGAGDEDGRDLPAGSFQLHNDAGLARYLGAAPPAGHGRHDYYFVVHAIDCASLGLSPETSNAMLGFNLFGHTLARATLVAWHEQA